MATQTTIPVLFDFAWSKLTDPNVFQNLLIPAQVLCNSRTVAHRVMTRQSKLNFILNNNKMYSTQQRPYSRRKVCTRVTARNSLATVRKVTQYRGI
uniref:Uncharacterized protein n=1 Tax=Pararge aegeria TaxID=116150 RepID=S4NTK8_9NEOP